jgi:hypothetical protein
MPSRSIARDIVIVTSRDDHDASRSKLIDVATTGKRGNAIGASYKGYSYRILLAEDDVTEATHQ